MAAAEIAFYTERLAQKEHELGEIKSAFHKYKLKQKVKYDSLKREIAASYGNNGGHVEEKQNAALLQIRVAELETELDESRVQAKHLEEELARRQTQLNDHMILIKNLESQLKDIMPSDKIDKKSQKIDMDKVHQQMVYKDQRIIELNNVILDKERQILDLQEMCREQGEVANSKNQAMKIVQRKLEQLEARGKRDVGTETDPSPAPLRPREREAVPRGASRSLSPGHAVVSRGAGGSSPPPLDPQDGEERLDDEMVPEFSGFKGTNLDEEVTLQKKQRKRVTFDLPPSTSTSMMNLNGDPAFDQLTADISRLSDENARLMAELDNKTVALVKAQTLLEENDMELAKLVRDTKHSSLKARAVAHSRIKELEETLSELNEQHVLQTSRLQIEMDTLRSTREWEIEQNGLLRNQLDQLREKNIKFTGELDATGKLNRDLEQKVTILTEELEDATKIAVMMDDERQEILDDVEKMKEAILAQDEFISLLEADIVIYEEHVGLLRDSLGASKVDHRSLLRSKAFETKLKALEQEKEQISIKSREEKLRTKALTQKVKLLEEENEKLMERLCEKEMGAEEDAEMAETCRQLELRLREADEQMVLQRTQYDIELETARVQHQQAQRELEELRYQLDASQRHQDHHQTNVQQEDNQQLLEQATSQETKLRELSQQITALEAELDAARVLNFDLESQAKEAKGLESDYDELIERHRVTCMELVEVKEKLANVDELKATVSSLEEENKTIREKTEELQRQNVVLTTELDAARVTFSETTLLKKELGHLQSELERERTVGHQKWEEFCKKALEGEYSEPGSRKSSMEIQKEQYIIAFEEKIDKLEEELAASNTKLLQEEQARNELELKLKDKEEAFLVKSEPLMTQQPHLEEEYELRLQEQEQKFEEQQTQLQNKIKDLEIENSLAAELGIEMGRVIQAYEAQISHHDQSIAEAEEKAHSAQMELRLHEMMNEELGTELDQLKQSQVNQENKLAHVSASLQQSETALHDQLTANRTLFDQNQALSAQVEHLQAQPPSEPTHKEHVSETIVFNETIVQQQVQQSESSPLSLTVSDNDILRQCVNETLQLQEDMSHDVERLLELKNELEIAVDALKGEIWTLNGQLKASILDREQLQDRVVQLDTSLAEEQRKSSALDCELSEQVELTEKATRQAAEAENESNRRLAECHEMESRRVELEQAYAQLTEYYNQLQAAYNQLYVSSQSLTTSEVQQSASTVDPSVVLIIDALMVDMQLETSSGMDTRAKITAIQQKIREKLQEVVQLNIAVREQGKVNEALQERMTTLEENTELSAGESLEMKNRLHQLEGDLEWKQEECDSLRRQVDELQQALNNVIVNDGDDAAKLATRQADVDSLFRTNAELVHTNVRLQNELDEREEKGEEEEGSSDEHEKLVEKVKQLEQKLAEWTESKEEIERLKSIEKTLNNRILSLEDQLLEKEEQLQEMEEQMIEQKAEDNSDQLRQLQQTNSVVMEELKIRREERDSLRRTIEEMECERNNKKEEAVSQREAEWNWDDGNTDKGQLENEIERLKKEKKEEEQRAAEEIKQYQDELEEMQTELEVMKQKLKMKEEKKEDAWDDWGEKEETAASDNLQEEVDRLTSEIEKVKGEHQAEKQEMEARIQSLEDELQQTEAALKQEMEDVVEETKKLKEELQQAENKKEESSEQWGWDESQPQESGDLQQEMESLRQNIDDLRQKLEESEKSEEQYRSQVAELETQLNSGHQSRESWNDGWGEEEEGQKQSEAELKNQLELAQQQLAIVSVELEEKKAELDELNRQLDEQKKKEQRLEAEKKEEFDELKQQLTQMKAENEEISQDLVSVRRELHIVTEKEKQLQQQNEELGKKLKESEEENIALKADKPAVEEKEDGEDWGDGWGESEGEKEDQNEELTQTKEQLQLAHQEIANLKSESEDLHHTVDELKEEIAQLKEKERSVQEALEQSEAKTTEEAWDDGWGESENNDGPSAEEQVLREELEKTQQELKETVQKLGLIMPEIHKLENTISDLEGKVEELTGANNRLQASLTEMAAKNEKLDQILASEVAQNEANLALTEELNQKLDQTSAKLAELQQECQLLREENLKLEEASTEQSQSKDDAWGDSAWGEEESKDSLKELEQTQEKLSEVSSRLEQAEVTVKRTTETARVQEEELRLQIQDLEEQVKVAQESKALRQELLEKTTQLADLTKQLDSVLKQNNLLKESEGRLLESVDEWGEIAEKNEEECKRLQKVVNDLERRQMELEEEIGHLKAEMEKVNISQPGPSNDTSALELEKLKKEHEVLKNNLLMVEAKLAEVEKEKSTIKASYDQLRSKIAARRAAANNTPSRAPSVASSIGDIREGPVPVPVTPLRFSPVPSTQQAQLSAQEADGKIRDFVGDVKEFADRVYSFASFRLDDIIGFEQSLNHLEMGKKGKKAAKKSSSNDVASDPPTATSPSPVTQEPTEGIGAVNGSEPLPQFDAQLLVDLAARLQEYNTEGLQNVQTEMLQWVSVDPNLNGDPHHLPAILPSVYSVLNQVAEVLSAQRANHRQAVEQMDADFKEKEESLVAGFQSQQFAAAVELKRVSEQLNSLSQDLAELDLLRRDASRLEKEMEEGRQMQEQLKLQNEEQEQVMMAKGKEVEEMKTALEQSQSELEAAKKKTASLLEQGDELYRKLFEMHQEGDQVDAMRLELASAKRREEEMEEKFGELHAVYGTMKDAFEEHLKKAKVLAKEREEDRRRVEEMQREWQRAMEEREQRLAEVVARLDEANDSLARKEFRLAQLDLEVEELRADVANRNTSTTSDHLQRSSAEKDLRDRNELLEGALEARNRELDVLQARVDELTSDAVFSYQELQNLTADRQSLMEDLNDARFQLEQVEGSERNSMQAEAKVLELQRKISIMESENYEKVAKITLQLQTYEEQLMTACEKEVEHQENAESLHKEISEWRSRWEALSTEAQAMKKAGLAVQDLESSLTEAKECASSLLAENASLRSQLAATCAQKMVAEEQVQGLAAQLQEGSNKLAEDLTDNQLKFRFVELESRLAVAERERDVLREQAEPKETRVQMEPDTSTAEGASDVESARPSASTSAHHSLLDDVVEHVRHSSLVRAGSPMTAPLVRKMRAFLSRRAIRPYLRYLVAGYFILLHFLLINCWLF